MVSRRVGTGALLAAAMVGLTAVAIFRRGALHDADAAAVGLVSTVVLAAGLARCTDRLAARVLVPFGGLAAWWMASAFLHTSPERFLPLGASILGFMAVFVVARGLAGGERSALAAAIVALGAISAAAGLVAEALRSFPLAERAQGLWRVATTLTYANAAGLLFAMALLLSVGWGARYRLTRLSTCLCAAGLVATQSRGAALAVVVGVLFVPWRTLLASLVPLLAGTAAGLVAVGTATGDSTHPVLVAAVVVTGTVALLAPPVGELGAGMRRRAGSVLVPAMLAVLGGLVVLGVVLAAGAPIGRRLANDRSPGWAAAVQQWETAELLGVGPDKPLVLDAATRTVTPFAQSEVLQVLADTGILGELLLVAGGLGLASVLSRRDPIAACAAGATVAFAVAGAVDIVWHLPALALVAGSAAGLSARPPPAPTAPAPTA